MMFSTAKFYLPLLTTLVLLLSCGSTTRKVESPEDAIPRSFFGLHVHRAAENNPTPWPEVPVPSWRVWDAHVKWLDLEPSRGQWRFETLDRYASIAEQHKTEILLPLATTPQWASARPNLRSGPQSPGLTAAPKDMNDWQTYVRQVASRYKGRILAYEIWNEPNLEGYWVGSTDQLVTMTKEAHDIIKSIDPQALIVSPSATSGGAGVAWLADFLRKGGGRYVDVVGFHFYVNPHPPEDLLSLIDKVKKTMQDNGVGDKPIWDTELGWHVPSPFPSDELAAAYLARSFILSWVGGVQRVYWYAWDNRNWVSLETTAADNKTVKPAGQAFGTIQQWLVGASMDGCKESADQVWTCTLHRDGNAEWILWTVADEDKMFSVPDSWHAQTATSLLGESGPVRDSKIQLSQVPVLVTTQEISQGNRKTISTKTNHRF